MAFDHPEFILSETRGTPLFPWVEERIGYTTSNLYSVVDKLDKVIEWCCDFECDLGPQPSMTDAQAEFFQSIWEVVLRNVALELHLKRGLPTKAIRIEMIRLSARLKEINEEIYRRVGPEEYARRRRARDAARA